MKRAALLLCALIGATLLFAAVFLPGVYFLPLLYLYWISWYVFSVYWPLLLGLLALIVVVIGFNYWLYKRDLRQQENYYDDLAEPCSAKSHFIRHRNYGLARWSMNATAGVILALMAVILILGAACGGDAPTPTISSPEPPTPTFTPRPPPPPCEDPTLEISVIGDLLQFDNDNLKAGAGTKVDLCFSNVSAINQHNWVLVNAGTKDDVAKRGVEAGAANGYVQPGDPDVITQTRLLDPGVNSEVRFTSPVPGTYQFVCTFPGHNITMFGDFTVTQ